MGNERIEGNIQRAFEGSREASERFFLGLLEGPLYVPERYQTYPLSDSPKYPNDFVNVLGVQDQERAVIPVFSDPALIKDWCGNELSYKTIDGSELLKLVPEEWWLVINPGCDIEKEISPWEVDQLKGGLENIPALLEELFPHNMVESLETRPLQEGELTKLTQTLTEFAQSFPEISTLFALKEEGLDLDGNKISTALVGVEANYKDMKELEALKDNVKDTAAPAMIGEDPFKVYVGTDRSGSLTLGIFKNAEPFYSRDKQGSNSLFHRFYGLFSKKDRN